MKAKRTACLALVAAATLVSGCGDDPEPEYFPQVLYRLEAFGGGACFRMDHISSSGARHELEAGRIFVLADGEPTTFLVANAPPPYQARFAWVEDGCPDTSGVLQVSGFEVQGPSAEPQVLSAAQPAVTVVLRIDVDTPLSTEIEGTPVRFEVCSPVDANSACGGGPTGRAFTGNIGDAFTSHILSQLESNDAATTPAIIFLEDARDRVSGIFRGLTDQRLRGELYIDGDLEDEQNSDGDVVLDSDL
jgi:hypothetical protein